MTAARSEVDRLRQCRRVFALAVARGLTMADARDLLARERWAEADRRLRDRHCGTAACVDEPERPLPWWQR